MTPLELVEKMLFSHPRKSKRRDALEAIKALLVEVRGGRARVGLLV